MRHVDFAPLYRSTVGFDRLFSLLDSQTLADNGQTYPPYNIERTGENAYRVTLAVAGFGTFEPRERSARTGRNPQTGETMQIAATTVPGFKAAAAFKKAVSG